MKQISQEGQNWLDERKEMFLNEGQKLFDLFKVEFNLEDNDARELIHSWDAKSRDVVSGSPKINK
jgi:hypothetical protein